MAHSAETIGQLVIYAKRVLSRAGDYQKADSPVMHVFIR